MTYEFGRKLATFLTDSFPHSKIRGDAPESAYWQFHDIQAAIETRTTPLTRHHQIITVRLTMSGVPASSQWSACSHNTLHSATLLTPPHSALRHTLHSATLLTPPHSALRHTLHSAAVCRPSLVAVSTRRDGSLLSDPGYMSRKILKFRTDNSDARNKRKFWLV